MYLVMWYLVDLNFLSKNFWTKISLFDLEKYRTVIESYAMYFNRIRLFRKFRAEKDSFIRETFL